MHNAFTTVLCTFSACWRSSWDNILFHIFQKAKVIEEWAGLRPSRNGVRHEAEELTLGNKSVKVCWHLPLWIYFIVLAPCGLQELQNTSDPLPGRMAWAVEYVRSIVWLGSVKSNLNPALVSLGLVLLVFVVFIVV